MNEILFDCVDGVYIANCGSLCLVLTQDEQEARDVGAKYLGYDVAPYWRDEPIDDKEYDISSIEDEIVKCLGEGGLGEFTHTSQDNGQFYLSGYSLF